MSISQGFFVAPALLLDFGKIEELEPVPQNTDMIFKMRSHWKENRAMQRVCVLSVSGIRTFLSMRSAWNSLLWGQEVRTALSTWGWESSSSCIKATSLSSEEKSLSLSSLTTGQENPRNLSFQKLKHNPVSPGNLPLGPHVHPPHSTHCTLYL